MTHRMPARARPGAAGEGRVFADESGRLWNATLQLDDVEAGGPSARGTSGHVVHFACISDSRQPARALAPEEGAILRDVADDVLRTWLSQAPRVGRLA